MITIIDYNLGNPHSVQNMLKTLGVGSIITSNHDEIQEASKLILPGVGHFEAGMNNLEKLGLIEVLNEAVIEKKAPILGICLGMQLFCKHSEEGNVNGLGWLDATIVKFKTSNPKMKIPHMGWAEVQIKQSNPICKKEEKQRFYFVHSYFAKCNNEKINIGTTYYFGDFSSIIGENNIYGCQFHPEKSHKFGKQLLQNFVNL